MTGSLPAQGPRLCKALLERGSRDRHPAPWLPGELGLDWESVRIIASHPIDRRDREGRCGPPGPAGALF